MKNGNKISEFFSFLAMNAKEEFLLEKNGKELM